MSKWEMVRLGDVGKVITGNTPPTSNKSYYESDDIQFYKPNDFEESIVNKLKNSFACISHNAKGKIRILPKGSVLTTCIGTIGKVGVLDNEATCNQQINAIIPNQRKINGNYLAYSILSKKNHLKDKANAPVVPIINKTQFANLQIALPPLEVQQIIARTLEAAAELITLRKQQLVELDNLIKSGFYDMFGDPVTNDKGWKIGCLGSIGVLKSGKFIAASEIHELSSRYEYPCFGGNGLRGYVEQYSHDGEYALIGRQGALCGNVQFAQGKFYATEHAVVVSPSVPINSQYLFYALKKLNLNKLATGAAQPGLTVGKLNGVQIQMPTLSLQNQFAEIVTKIEEQKALVQKAIDESQYLFDSLMNEYFN